MKIIHLITRLDFGGSSENVILSAQGSVEAGHDVLIASGPSSVLTELASGSGVSLVVLPDLIRSIHPWRDIKAFFEIIRLLREQKPDIVHTHSSKAGVLGRWAAWFCRVPRIIHTPHGHVFYGYFGALRSAFYLALERTTATITDDLVALSEGEKRESLERGVGRPEQWSVVDSGVSAPLSSKRLRKPDAAALLRAQIPETVVVIGCIARLEPVKGIGILVEAAAHVRLNPAGRNAVFLVIGEGELRAQLEARIKALSLGEAVIFAGYQKDPWSFLSMMDIYIQPSLNEGMGKTLVMAQQAGLPIVASRVCGIPDVVRDEETGLLTPPSNPAALAAAILRLLNDEGLRKSMSQNAKAWVASPDETGHARFSAESMVARLNKLYARR